MKLKMLAVFATIAAALGATSPLSAQDLAGAYAGLEFGRGKGTSYWGNNSTVNTTGDFDIDGNVGGLFGGYNWVKNNLMFGAEAEVLSGDVQGITNSACATCDTNVTRIASLKGRLGWILPAGGAIYAVIGVNRTEVTTHWNGGNEDKDSITGRTVGLGYEHPLPKGWSIRGEIERLNYNDGTFENITGSSRWATVTDVNLLTIGVAKHF